MHRHPGEMSALPSLSWASESPRRTVKACTSCRRDKIKCDNERPCSGCVKKGYPKEQCIDGCEPCRRARKRCCGGTPCTRCTELQLYCTDELHPPASPLDVTSGASQSSSPERAKLACRSCRRDNKKCDNGRPCGRCVARNEECVKVGRGPKQVKVRCQGCRETNQRCEDERPCRFCVATRVECFDPPRKGTGHGVRVKSACKNCRRDKVRCDGERPCVSCRRKGLTCIDEQVSNIHENQAMAGTSSDSLSFTSVDSSVRSSSTDDSYHADVERDLPPLVGTRASVVQQYNSSPTFITPPLDERSSAILTDYFSYPGPGGYSVNSSTVLRSAGGVHERMGQY
ncbi:uncharacterized protein STEHIDRAFT_147278 [Stereum hirsutum FP-91666 SS1]|uniref:uncharacterized protein n=1 Tax=Stereum hirsutum (strain FP-91666) TaxID=721885 RepID=UPI000444A5A3|nr:uncharacterized protein STEHIDRAFT_147278 [Stereum hirsutum FP-91666 SS1]EIM86804.1 hypothetical protein STEHIDRAFT_147278 [Stereum hirsutum FP-91666 SS1]